MVTDNTETLLSAAVLMCVCACVCKGVRGLTPLLVSLSLPLSFCGVIILNPSMVDRSRDFLNNSVSV